MNTNGPRRGRSETAGRRRSEGTRNVRRAATFAAVDAELELRERLVAVLDALDEGDVDSAALNVLLVLGDLDDLLA